MTSYFDEHSTNNTHEMDFLELIRSLLSENLELAELFRGEKPAPPASKAEVDRIMNTKVDKVPEGCKCPICLASLLNELVEMPCKHVFHKTCLSPWLQKTNSCPSCRLELLTDDSEYEEYKMNKKKAEEREERVEEFHNSMYS